MWVKKMDNYLVTEIKKDIAIEFIQKYHYSKILPRLTKFYLGIFSENEMIGVITLGWGTQPLQTIQKIFHKHEMKTTDYLEIGKMCFLPKSNNDRHSGSLILSKVIKWAKKNTECKFIYTLADGIMGKCGFVYQASNFKYLGYFKTSVYMDKTTKEKIHPRSAKSLCIENAIYEKKQKVFWLTHDFCEYKGIEKINGIMFRYIFPLRKESKNILKKYEEYKNLKNPKNEDLIFEKRVLNGKFQKIQKPEFNMNVFNYNFQKY